MKIFNKKKLFFLVLLVPLLLAVNTDLFSLVSAKSAACVKYERYEEKYNQKTDKQRYLKVKNFKRNRVKLYQAYKNFYNIHRKESKEQIAKLSQTQQKVFDAYKSYLGYKYYREYKEVCETGGDDVIITHTLTYTAGTGGTITGETSQTLNSGENGATVTAVADAGYHFVNWSDSVTTAARRDLDVSDNISVTANFAVDVTVTYSFNYSAGSGGTVSGTLAQTVNAGSSGTAITVVPNSGYHFVSWSDSGTANPRTDSNANANISVIATFAINTYTLAYTAGTGGTISGTSPQTVNYGSSASTVSAVADAGYHFVRWSDNIMSASRTDSGVTADVSVSAVFEANATYTLTYTAGTGGTISGTSPQTVNYASSGTAVTAVPNTGYAFVSWSDGVATAIRTDTNVVGNVSATATFAINTYTLTYTAGTGGTITGTSPQTINYSEDGSSVTAVPATGYHFVSWSDASTANPRTDLDVVANISVTATFAINTYTLTYTAGTGGTITGTSPQTINYGEDGSAVTAVPATGYHFVEWSDQVDEATRQDVDVASDVTVTATFASDTFTLTYAAGPNGSITGTSPQTINYGEDGSAVAAVPDVGYQFVEWSDFSTANPRTDLDVTSNISVTAAFTTATYTFTYTAGAGGTITGTSPQTVSYGGDGSVVTAVADTGYHFVKWDDDVMTAERTDLDAIDNVTVTAIFAMNTFTLAYAAGDNGAIMGTNPQTINYGDDGSAVTAVADEGYHFVSWSDSSTANPRTDLDVVANITVTATFAASAEYTLTYTAGEHGSITGTSPQTVFAGEDGSAVTAVADSGYHFVSWSDSSTANPRTDLDVAGNISVTASFAVNAPLTVSTISPSSAYNYGSVALTSITGTSFATGATVKLTKSGETDITCTGFTVASETSITGGSCNISSAATGTWNVVVTNTDTGTDTLEDGFTVINGAYSLRDTGPAGGLIFYINPNYATDGWKYLEVAPADQGIANRWVDEVYCTTLVGSSGMVIGTGLSNTNIMKAGLPQTSPLTSALELAANYTYNGYTDWFIPSQLELAAMYDNLHKITELEPVPVGGFAANSYWSSSEYSATQSYRQSFSTGIISFSNKTSNSYILRAARRF